MFKNFKLVLHSMEQIKSEILKMNLLNLFLYKNLIFHASAYCSALFKERSSPVNILIEPVKISPRN